MEIKRIISSIAGAAVLASSMTALTGCMTLQEFFTGERFEEETAAQLTNREWLNMVNEAYGMESSEEELIEDAKDWGIIGEDEEIDLDAPADEEFVTTTLARAAGYTDADSTYEEAKRAIEEHGLLNEGDIITEPQTAQETLVKVQEDMVHPQFEDHREIQLADNVHDLTNKLKTSDFKVSGNIVTLPLSTADELDKDHVFILPGDEYGDEASYKVIAIVDNGDDTADVKCVPATLCEVYRSVNVSGHFPADLKEFVAADNGMISVMKNGTSGGTFNGYSKEKLMSDENDSIVFSTVLGDGSTVDIAIKDIILNAKIDWSSADGKPDIKRIFLSADYISDVSIESADENGGSTLLSGLLSSMPVDIGRVPVHICGGLTVYLDLSLTADAEGEISVKVKTGETNGFEMKGAKFRTINAVLDLSEVMTDRRVSEASTLRIAVGMDYLLDDEEFVSLDITSGPEIKGEAKVHSDAGEDGEKLVCVDVSGFLKVAVNAHFCDAVVEKTGFDPIMKLLDLDKEKSRIRWEGIHYENGVKVPACTFEEKAETTEGQTEESTKFRKGKFELEETYIIISEGETAAVALKSLPDGYTMDDLVWISDNEDIVKIDAKGNVTGVSGGTCQLRVETKDGIEKLSFAVKVNSSR